MATAMKIPTILVRPRGLGLLAVCCALLFLAGCGKGTGKITGTVTHQGKPLPAGGVLISPADGKGTVSATIKKDGTYEANGVPTGPAKVAVIAIKPPPPVPGMMGSGSGMRPGGGGPGKLPPGVKAEDYNAAIDPSIYVKIDPKYEDPEKSGFTLTVKSGSQTFNIEIP